jgi:pyruvate/2-oxoglutarate dehydrogenase complex dihydrolipoamide acyltransferase (E2) component
MLSRTLVTSLRRAYRTASTRSVAALSQNTSCKRTFLSTPTLLETHTINVPTMGDSITEGTIVEWVVPLGGKVAEGDVICLIETDKVTVDIKAEREGVVVKHLGEVEGVVEVGEGLYVLDTDLSVASSAGTAEPAQSKSEAASIEEIVKETPAPAARIPSIHFLGKEGWNALRNEHSQSTSKSTNTTTPGGSKPHSPTSVTYTPYVHMYGRPSITDEEMEALLLGGAEEAPEMKKDKGGVVTFYGGKVVTAGPRGVWLAEETM